MYYWMDISKMILMGLEDPLPSGGPSIPVQVHGFSLTFSLALPPEQLLQARRLPELESRLQDSPNIFVSPLAILS